MAVLPALAACNAIVGFGELQKVAALDTPDPVDGGKTRDGEAPPKDGSAPDAPPTTGCDPKKPFGAPVALAGPVSSAAFELSPSLTTNELAMVFQRTIGVEGGSLMMATRATTADAFGEPVELAALASGLDGIQQPSMTADGLLLFFVGVTGPDADLYAVSRATPSSTFELNQRRKAIEVNTGASESVPKVTPDGAELWFSVQDGVEPRRLVRSVRDNIGGYAAAAAVSELGSPQGEAGAAFSKDGLTIYFGSERPGGKGAMDIWTAQRASMAAPFGAPTVVAELNSPTEDYPGYLSADGCRLYFDSDRSGGVDIFVATRPR
jgi:hypothetical protein